MSRIQASPDIATLDRCVGSWNTFNDFKYLAQVRDLIPSLSARTFTRLTKRAMRAEGNALTVRIKQERSASLSWACPDIPTEMNRHMRNYLVIISRATASIAPIS